MVAVRAAAVGIFVVVAGRRADQAPFAARPELQRVLVELTSGSARIAPGATAYVAGPHGTWVKAPGFHADLLRIAKRLQADPTTRFPPTVWIRLAATQPLYFPPSSGYHYSNVGFEVLGLVIQRVTGQPLEVVYRRPSR